MGRRNARDPPRNFVADERIPANHTLTRNATFPGWFPSKRALSQSDSKDSAPGFGVRRTTLFRVRTELGLSVTSMPVRTARLEDARQIAEVHVSSWRAAYRGIVPDALLDSLSVKAWTGLWQERLSRVDETINLVLVLGESVLGLITAGPARDPDCDLLRTQEVYAIYLSSEYWGCGRGT